MSEDEYLLKICILCSSLELVLKLLNTFRGYPLSKDWIEKGKTTGVVIDATIKVQVDDNKVKLIFCMINPSEWYQSLRPSYYRGTSACSIFFDKSDLKSFKTVPTWFTEFRKHIPDPTIPVALVGIITNFEQVTVEEGQTIAQTHNMCYYETQVTDYEQIRYIFHELTRQVLSG